LGSRGASHAGAQILIGRERRLHRNAVSAREPHRARRIELLRPVAAHEVHHQVEHLRPQRPTWRANHPRTFARDLRLPQATFTVPREPLARSDSVQRVARAAGIEPYAATIRSSEESGTAPWPSTAS